MYIISTIYAVNKALKVQLKKKKKYVGKIKPGIDNYCNHLSKHLQIMSYTFSVQLLSTMPV